MQHLYLFDEIHFIILCGNIRFTKRDFGALVFRYLSNNNLNGSIPDLTGMKSLNYV